MEYKPGKHSVFTDTLISKVIDKRGVFTGYEIVSNINKGINEFIYSFKITKRELQILDLCLDGFSSRIIAEKLDIRERTVDTHICNIFNKTGVSSRIELFSLSAKYGLISGE